MAFPLLPISPAIRVKLVLKVQSSWGSQKDITTVGGQSLTMQHCLCTQTSRSSANMWKISHQGSIKSINNDSVTKGRDSFSYQVESIDSWEHALVYERAANVYQLDGKSPKRGFFLDFANYHYWNESFTLTLRVTKREAVPNS